MGHSNDLALTRKAWEIFHAKKNPKLIELKGKAKNWPKAWGYAGESKTIYYASDKWERNGNFLKYYHDQGRNIGLWLPRGSESWLTEDPLRTGLRPFPQSLTVLGYWVGLDYKRGGKMQRATPEGNELLCSYPNCHHLAVVDPAVGVVALVSGPGLVVGQRGIVG